MLLVKAIFADNIKYFIEIMKKGRLKSDLLKI